MTDLSQIKPHAEVIGADGVHVGTVDHIDGGRIKLTKQDSSDQHHHYIDTQLIAEIEDGKVRLSANADVAILFENRGAEEDQGAADDRLDEGLEETFPASDPVATKNIS